jgi:hypothetical protein
VTQLGLRHHLVTPWTSLVAVDTTSGPDAMGVEGATAAAQAMLSPARTLPGDPEIRVAAPADARAVTVDLPFGETVQARWDAEAGEWIARFLVPRDAEEGPQTVRVTITLADGTREVRSTGYVVDSTPPRLAFQVRGEARPGALVTVRATQVVSGAARSGRSHALGAVDARRVELRMPDGVVFPMAQTARGVWEAKVRVPEDASGTLHVHAYAVDLAANVGGDRGAWPARGPGQSTGDAAASGASGRGRRGDERRLRGGAGGRPAVDRDLGRARYRAGRSGRAGPWRAAGAARRPAAFDDRAAR